jgi:hypothetical protein
MPITPEWRLRIEQAQDDRTVELDGQTFDRVRCDEANGCPDCACDRGQFHVFGCDQERCPRCKTGQAITCDCDLH